MRFVDTNVLLYAASTNREERAKRERARAVLGGDDLALSVQVLQEFYVQATHRSRKVRMGHDQASLLIESWLRFRVVETTVRLLQEALTTAARYRISYWDAAIVEAARAAGCSTLVSEDLQDGMDFAGVRVDNPFR